MSWAIGYSEHWKRDVGYGVIAYCDHPKCHEEIDRGLSYICGGGPDGENPGEGRDGCGLFFCSKHGGGWLCPRCQAYKPAYKHPKPEHPGWINWKMTDESWAEWRTENQEWVSEHTAIAHPDSR